MKHVRPAVEKTRPNVVKNPDVDRLEEDVNRMAKRWGNCCMQVWCNYYSNMKCLAKILTAQQLMSKPRKTHFSLNLLCS